MCCSATKEFLPRWFSQAWFCFRFWTLALSLVCSFGMVTENLFWEALQPNQLQQDGHCGVNSSSTVKRKWLTNECCNILWVMYFVTMCLIMISVLLGEEPHVDWKGGFTSHIWINWNTAKKKKISYLQRWSNEWTSTTEVSDDKPAAKLKWKYVTNQSSEGRPGITVKRADSQNKDNSVKPAQTMVLPFRCQLKVQVNKLMVKKIKLLNQSAQLTWHL